MTARRATPASLVLVALLVIPGVLACGPGSSSPQATDYSLAAHWLALPIAPAPTYPVDVFYLYPTAWTSTDSNPQICAIDEPTMLVQAPQAYARQATAFETVGNVYAPFYRQDNLSSVDRWNVIAGIPTLDATAAFDFYIQNFNEGRPFILVGHSQGATVLTNILSGYLRQNPAVLARMVAAYVIGSPITAQFLAQNPQLKFATGADDVGVIVSWNTEGPGVVPGTSPVLYGMVGLVINPISWTRTAEQVPASQGLGSFMPSLVGKSVVWGPVGQQVCDARIDAVNGVLICTTAPQDLMDLVDKASGFPKGVYHTFDIPFFYANLGQNAAVRVQRYLGHELAAR
ncbi:MAG: DUF3089 domain-containing protein [Deltaproteobacteria bacterium]